MKIKEKESWLLPKNFKDDWSNQYQVLEIDVRKTQGGQDWPIFKVIALDGNDLEYCLSSWALQAPKGKEIDVKPGTIIELIKKPGLDTRFICNLYQPPKLIKVADLGDN